MVNRFGIIILKFLKNKMRLKITSNNRLIGKYGGYTSMKRHLAVAVALSVTLGVSSIAPYAPSFLEATQVEASSFSYTQEQQQALNHLNAIRAKMGIKPVELNVYLNKSAENHANYLSINGLGDGHTELRGKKGFTGATTEDRMKAVGLSIDNYTARSEVVASVQDSIAKAIDGFMDTAYHRQMLLSSSVTEIGVAIKGGMVVIDMVSTDSSQDIDIAYPYNGQKGVGIGYYGNEDPDPLALFGVDKSGYIISYTPAPEFFVETLNFKLKDSKGSTVPVYENENWVGTSFYFPKQELKFGEKYTVSVSYVDEYTGKKGSKTWSFTTKTKDGQPTQPTNPTGFADFKTGQYWSDNMLWAIEKGLISGYTNVKNPQTGKLENLIKPQNNLTESQFLAVLFRYTNPDELNSTKPATSWWASAPYQLAEKYKLPTNATLSNRTNADKPISRGKMAQILVSKYQGEVVSEKAAVDFFIKNKISSQKDYKDFMPTQTLSRAHIVTFMKNYDTYLETLNK